MILKVGGRKREVGIDDVEKMQKAMFESNLSDRDQMVLDALLEFNKAEVRLFPNTVPSHTDETEIPDHCLVNNYGGEMKEATIIEIKENELEVINAILAQNEAIIKMNQELLDRITNPMMIYSEEGK